MNKKLSNPPVYYTIAQAQFNPVAAMESYINEIQDKLRRDGYTLFQSQKVSYLHLDTSLSTSFPKPEVRESPIWRMTKSDQKSGFILSQSHLTYHTTHYETHTQFFDAFLKGLQTVHAVVKLDHLSQLGLRYLNAVLPVTDEALSKYLVAGLQGISIRAPLRYSLDESVFDTKMKHFSHAGTLVNRVLCRSGALSYPPDIAPHDLIPKFARKQDPCHHAIIDIDHFIQGKLPVDFEQLKNQLGSLHAEIKTVFEANITDYAKKVWE